MLAESHAVPEICIRETFSQISVTSYSEYSLPVGWKFEHICLRAHRPFHPVFLSLILLPTSLGSCLQSANIVVGRGTQCAKSKVDFVLDPTVSIKQCSLWNKGSDSYLYTVMSLKIMIFPTLFYTVLLPMSFLKTDIHIAFLHPVIHGKHEF